MARMNHLLDKYGVRPTARAAQDPPPVEPPEPEIPPVGREDPQDPHRSMFRIKSGTVETPSELDVTARTGSFHRKTVETRPPDPIRAGTGERGSMRQENEETGPIPGTFGQSRRTRSASADGRGDSPARRRRVCQSIRDLIERLPPLWWVDLMLILISLVGIIAILTHLPAVLLALAKMICSIISLLFGIVLWILLGAVALFCLRSRFR